MSITYRAEFHIDLGDAVPQVGELVDSVKTHLSTMGYDEKLMITSNVFNIDVTVDRELTAHERHKMKCILECEYIKALPDYSIRLTSFGRKSGNVVQSVVR